MIQIKTMKFPSTNFPGADLRVNPDTEYAFQCVSCNNRMSIPFGWLLGSGSEPISDVTPEIETEIRQYLEENSQMWPRHRLDICSCKSCGIIHLIQSEIDEIWWGIYRVEIRGAAQLV